MSNYTPGPWRVIETHLLPYDGDHVADMSNDLMVVSSFKLGDPLADAQLIAAAPDLLGALQKIAQMDYGNPYASGCVEIARAAIAKAEGGAA